MIANLLDRAKRVADMNDDRPSVAPALEKIAKMLALAGGFETGANMIRGNQMLPESGRRKLLQDAGIGNVMKIQTLANEIAEERRCLGNERRARERLPAAPTDAVSIQIRAELRAHLLDMTPQQRLAATRVGNISPELLHAILEAPPELSGLPGPVVENLRAQIVRAKGCGDFDSVDNELAALAGAAIKAAEGAAGAASEMEPGTFARRVSGVRSELAPRPDPNDLSLGQLLEIAATPA